MKMVEFIMEIGSVVKTHALSNVRSNKMVELLHMATWFFVISSAVVVGGFSFLGLVWYMGRYVR